MYKYIQKIYKIIMCNNTTNKNRKIKNDKTVRNNKSTNLTILHLIYLF